MGPSSFPLGLGHGLTKFPRIPPKGNPGPCQIPPRKRTRSPSNGGLSPHVSSPEPPQAHMLFRPCFEAGLRRVVRAPKRAFLPIGAAAFRPGDDLWQNFGHELGPTWTLQEQIGASPDRLVISGNCTVPGSGRFRGCLSENRGNILKPLKPVPGERLRQFRYWNPFPRFVTRWSRSFLLANGLFLVLLMSPSGREDSIFRAVGTTP